MIQRKTRWVAPAWSATDGQDAQRLSHALNISPLAARLLVQRGFIDPVEAERFLYGDVQQLHDPFLLKDMDKAVAAIRKAGESGEKLLIFGDYDADGVTSTSLLIHLFDRLGYTFDYYIPHRVQEGYGLNKDAIEKAAEDGYGLIVTVDTGISAANEIAFAYELGLQVVVTDHHEPPAVLPVAEAVVNPKRQDCEYPFKGLAGVGVAFKLAQALLGYPPLEWTTLVAVGTVADLMPLLDENRVLVREGIAQLRTTTAPGFQALARVGSNELADASATMIAFGMAPRINAAGRLGSADLAVSLLTAANEQVANELASTLDKLNRDRQKLVEVMVQEADAGWNQKCAERVAAQLPIPNVIVLAGHNWHVGVIGIVAAKLLDRYYRPVVILGIDEESGKCKGSARSIEGFDLHAALTESDDLLEHYGGHQAAAGMSLNYANIDALEQRLHELAEKWLTTEDWIPTTSFDQTCRLDEASTEAISELALLEPFGVGNVQPCFQLEQVVIKDCRKLGKEEKHLKLRVEDVGASLEVIGFGSGYHANRLYNGCKVDLLGTLNINEWNGQRKPQLQLIDLHAAPLQDEDFPERAQFIQVYSLIKQQRVVPLPSVAHRFAKQTGYPVAVVQFIIDVFLDLAFLKEENNQLVATQHPEKRELQSSTYYKHVLQSMKIKELS